MPGALARAVAGAVAVVVTGPVAAASAAAEPTCGATITTDVVLTADLLCPDGAGLTLVGDVTLDLGGHTLAGPGRGGTGTGVTFDPSVSTITVTNGTLRDWPSAVRSTGDPGDGTSALVDVVVRDNGLGVGGYFDGYTISGSTFEGNGDAVVGFYATLTVDSSTFTGNDVGLSASTTRTAVTASRFEGNRVGLFCSESALSVHGSAFVANERGLDHWWCGGVDVTGTLFERNDVAYRADVPSTPDTLTENTFHDNTVGVDAQASVELVANVFTANGTGVRAPVDPLDEVVVVLQGNRFTRNVDAVVVETRASVGGNEATYNAGRGLYAPRATDLGGNVAYGNRARPQCVGVVCAGRPASSPVRGAGRG